MKALPSAPRPRLYRLSTQDADRSVDDPALALLAAEGWTVAGTFQAIEARHGAEVVTLVLVLWPPPAPRRTAETWWAFPLTIGILAASFIAIDVIAWFAS